MVNATVMNGKKNIAAATAAADTSAEAIVTLLLLSEWLRDEKCEV